jgi:hypothetical protein
MSTYRHETRQAAGRSFPALHKSKRGWVWVGGKGKTVAWTWRRGVTPEEPEPSPRMPASTSELAQDVPNRSSPPLGCPLALTLVSHAG